VSDLWRLALGHRLGQGADSSALKRYLPSIAGIYPVWHHASTTPNTDGAISAIADVSLGLYPLSQGTPANQPSRGSGKITFDGDDWLETADATLCGFATGSAFSLLMVVEMNSGTPGTRNEVGGWGDAAVLTENGYLAHSAADFLEAYNRHGGTNLVATGATALDATRRTYMMVATNGASGNVLSYIGNVLEATSGTGNPGSNASDRFSLGGVFLGANPTSSLSGAIIAACAVSIAADATMRGQWENWANAGCPL